MTHKSIAIAAVAIMGSFIPVGKSAFAQDASAPAAPAAAAGSHPLLDKFEAANTTHDGHLTLAQAQAGKMPMVARNFSAIDADNKGYITLGDIRHFLQARRAAHQGHAASPHS